MAELTPSEKDVAARLFNHLVTPSGMKIAHELPDLVDFGEVPLAELQPVLSTLSERRILRSLRRGRRSPLRDLPRRARASDARLARSHDAERELELEREASDRRHRRLLG